MKSDYSTRGAFDEVYTPVEAVEMIMPYIPIVERECFDTEWGMTFSIGLVSMLPRIWEPTAIKESKIVSVLSNAGYKVIGSHIENGKNFFTYEPDEYDMIITNPPYSMKDDFLKRVFDLDKPFMFLLPLTALEGQKRSRMFSKHKIQLLIPDKRFNFQPDKKSGIWFQTSWFCYKCNLPNDLNFIQI